MITVDVSGLARGATLTCSPDAETVIVRVSGHSGYASKGSDIVCAGVSVLVQAAAKVLASHFVKFTAERESAYMSVEIPVKDLGAAERTVIALTLETAVSGVEMMAESYPGNVQIRFDN